TTTPWTLPSNVALAVKADADYVVAKLEDGTEVVVAEALATRVLGDAEEAGWTLVETLKGEALAGSRYEAPFAYATPENGRAHEVIVADFVELGAGTGLVHLAPAFGEDDFRVCKAAGMGFLQLVEPDGTFPPEVTDFAGRFCKEADRDIIRNLRRRGILFKEEVYKHEYPFSWRRMSDPLIQYARTSWFIRTTREIEKTKANNQHVNWEPRHIKDGRFGQFLEGNVDWALSRERFWGTPLPIWVNDETGAMDAVGSVAEILERNAQAFDHFHAAKAEDPTLQEDLMVHKPWIDDVTWTREGEPGVYRRVPEVIDCWFDSGCMPFAQWGYPHQNAEAFEACFPADFITEAVDQTRGWFYSLMTISTLLFGEAGRGEGGYPHPFRNCVVLGLLTDEKGLKYSKSLKNYTDPLELMERTGADAVRWALYANTVPGQNTRFFEGAANDAAREFLLKIWNVYSFFVSYANIDMWSPAAATPPLADRADLDRWILAELDETTRRVRAELDAYKSHQAVKHVSAFVDALSNWYVRRSRARFWAGGAATGDKAAAFATLHEVLADLSKLIAPFVPFLAEAMYQNLVRQQDAGAPASVHLAAYPEPDEARADAALREAVALTRAVVTAGNRVRNEHQLKVRQPLGEAIVVVAGADERAGIERFAADVRDELNVEVLAFTDEPAKFVNFELLPNFRVLGPKLGKQVPACKKALAEADGSALHAEMSEQGSITVTLPDGDVELTKDEVQVRLAAKEGFAAASEQGHVVVLDTTLTEPLRRKGWAREVTSRIQKARKELGLALDDRITLRWDAEGALTEAVTEHAERIAGDVLATTFERSEGLEGGVASEVDGAALRIVVSRADG
ncbi:MAG: class I tRNA ligase family protein, partial [Myxococcota bacterium]